MTERLFHAGVRGLLWHDRADGIYVITVNGHEAPSIEARSYDSAVAQFNAAAECIAAARAEVLQT